MTAIAPLEPFVSFRFAGFNVDLPEHGDPFFNQLDKFNERLLRVEWVSHENRGKEVKLYVRDGVDDAAWLDCLRHVKYLTQFSIGRYDSNGNLRRTLNFNDTEFFQVSEQIDNSFEEAQVRKFSFLFGELVEN